MPDGGSGDDDRPTVAVPSYQQLAETLRGQILAGALGSGDRLPSEAELVAQFGVSRSTVREALRLLASRDLVHTRRGATGGTFVNHVGVDEVSKYLETSLGLMSGRDGLRVADMLEAREILEVPVVRLAALRRSDADLAALREAWQREQDGDPGDGGFTERSSFHRILVDAAQNPMLTMMTAPLFRVLQTRLVRPEAQRLVAEEADRSHAEILDAIAHRDADRAAEAMVRHLATLRDVYLE